MSSTPKSKSNSKSKPAPKNYDRIHISLQRETKQRLHEYAAAKGLSKGSIVEAALREYLDDHWETELVLKELGRLRRGVNRLERGMDVMDAVLSGYVQLWLAYHPPLPQDQKVQAQKLAAQRFEQLITFLQNQLSQQRTFGSRMAEETLLKREDIRSLLDQELGRQEQELLKTPEMPDSGAAQQGHNNE